MVNKATTINFYNYLICYFFTGSKDIKCLSNYFSNLKAVQVIYKYVKVDTRYGKHKIILSTLFNKKGNRNNLRQNLWEKNIKLPRTKSEYRLKN